MTSKPPLFFLMGPTASGKTDMAVKLTRELPFDIISVDSVMVYRGLDIGSAKPDASTLRQAPHRLVNICDAAEPYSVAKFKQDALCEIRKIHDRGRLPLLVGGTFLYFRALQQGLSPLPDANPEIRDEIETQAEQLGWPAMHAALKTVDAESAQRIHPNDPQRIQRALEVYRASGISMSEWFRQQKEAPLPFNIVKLVLAPQDRADLHKKIERRFNAMIENGFVDEVRSFYQREDIHPNLPSMRAVGYRQIWAYLEGELAWDSMIKSGITATRQFAKRQFTWLRSEQNAYWYNAEENRTYNNILKKLMQTPICKTQE